MSYCRACCDKQEALTSFNINVDFDLGRGNWEMCVQECLPALFRALGQTRFKLMFWQSVCTWNASVILHLLPEGFHETSWGGDLCRCSQRTYKWRSDWVPVLLGHEACPGQTGWHRDKWKEDQAGRRQATVKPQTILLWQQVEVTLGPGYTYETAYTKHEYR